MEPEGIIVFSTVGVSYYGFDVFSVNLPSFPTTPSDLTEHRHTDCVSVNYNAQFLDDSNTVTFVSERSGTSRLYHTSNSNNHPNTLPTIPESFFHDRPTIRNDHLYFVSNHESLGSFRASSAVYSARLDTNQIDRLTPPSVADLSPAISRSGKLIAVASYGSEPWKGDFRELLTDIVIFPTSDPSHRTKRWTLLEEPAVFYTAWSPVEKGVIFVSMGPIFQSQKATVQIARITFDPYDLTDECDKVPAEAKILTCTGTGNNAFPSCSPDGRELVFRSGRSGHKNLYILDAVNGELEGGGGIRKLTDGEWIDTMPCWSPDSNLIAFSSNRHNPKSAERFGLYVVRPDGTELRRVVVAEADTDRERINHVCFSPDSKWLLFTANLGGVSAEPVSMANQFQPYGDLYICRLDGTGLRRLTYNAYENGTPAWYSCSDAPEIGSLSLQASTGDKLRGNFDEPLWINCEL